MLALSVYHAECTNRWASVTVDTPSNLRKLISRCAPALRPPLVVLAALIAGAIWLIRRRRKAVLVLP
jgi:MYXO-CTERM domain-containing protein